MAYTYAFKADEKLKLAVWAKAREPKRLLLCKMAFVPIPSRKTLL
jgi:hypothetical protein